MNQISKMQKCGFFAVFKICPKIREIWSANNSRFFPKVHKIVSAPFF